MQWPEAASEAESAHQRNPERRRHCQETQSGGYEQTTDQDDHVGGHHPAVERSPPEVEGFHPGAAENQEGQDQPDVRWIEDVGAAVPNDIFG